MKYLLLALTLLCTTNCADALELTNIVAGQDGNAAYLAYDITNLPGERSADVRVEIEIDGNRYEPGNLAMSGDYGIGVPVGKGKKILWKILKDMPAGYEGNISWHIGIKPDKSAGDPFRLMPRKTQTVKLTDKTVLDIASDLMWPRHIKFGAPADLDEARAVTERMNKTAYGGYTDWRIPTEDEWGKLIRLLTGMFKYTQGKSMAESLKKAGFINVTDGYYWTNDMIAAETYNVDYNVNRYKARVDANVNSTASGASTLSSTSSSNRTSTTNSARTTTNKASASRLNQTTASAELSLSKVRTEGTPDCNAVINIGDGYMYKMQLSTKKAILLPVRGENSMRVVQAKVKVTP
jgi:Protein of unknown function (DUF1566)